jgi:HK97 family phage portal protein
MSILDIFRRKPEKRSFESDFLSGNDLYTSDHIRKDNALQLSAVQACVRVLSETVGGLPLFVYKETDAGKEKAKDHPLYNILHLQPNEYMDSFTFFQTSMTHLLLWGNSYIEIMYKKGVPSGLFLIHPDIVTKIVVKGKPWYKIKVDNTERFLRDEYVMHLMYMTQNGVNGISPIEEASNMFDLSYSAQKYSLKFYENGLNVSGVLEHPGTIGDEARDNLIKSFSRNQGLENSHRLLIVEEGMKFTKRNIPPNEAQMIETRKFQIEDIARIYRVPLHLIQSLDQATNNNIEHQSLDFVRYSLTPWLSRWERAFKVKLFQNSEYFAEFNVNGLLRGDYKTRMEGYSIARQNGFMSVNEIRTLENMNKIKDGDIYLQPLNMTEVGKEPEIEKKSVQIDEKRAENAESKRVLEIRRANAAKRHDITQGYQDLMQKAFEAIAKREKADIMRKLEKKNQDPNSIKDFIQDFYEKHNTYMEDKILPIAESLAVILERNIADELDSTPDIKEAQKIASNFTQDYITKYIIRHRSQLLGLIKENRDEFEAEEEEFVTVVRERITEWVEKQPDKSSLESIIQLAGFVVSAAIFNRGRKIRWFNTGSDTCKFCQELDGKIVGRDEPFVNDGQNIKGMVVNGPKLHPPLHQGCVCQIGPD